MSWPLLVGVVPPVAVGRLERPVDGALEAAVTARGAALVCQVLAGLGGVGKTQLAANLAHRWWRERRVDLLIWVTATSRAAVLTRYAQAAADVTGVEDPDPGDGARRLLAWLSATDRRWLLVLDDLTDPADLQGLWPPVTPAGATIVTTRRRDAALLAGAELIDVGVFTAVEAVGYLHSQLGDQPRRLDEAAELAADLGGLPLALAQAAAYIVDQDLTCAGYRRRLTRRRLHMLRPVVLPDDQPTPVADTWALSIDLADAATGGIAGILLRLAALLDPNGIPARLFATAAVTGYCTARTGEPVDADDTHDALRALHRLSLLTAPRAGGNDDGGVVRVHALLQRVVREHTPAEDEHDLAVTAADAINQIWPDREPDAGTAQSLRTNTIVLHQHTGRHLWTTTGAGHPILFRTGHSLGDTGLVAAARDYFDQLHRTATAHLGPDHPATLTTRNSLAYWRGEAGDPAGAAAALQHLLDDSLRVLGPDHPGILTTRHDLAYWRGQAGDPAGAAAALQQLLDDSLRVLGPDHPGTLTTRHDLAYWRGQAGDPAGAAAALERLLDDYLRVLGPDHPGTLTTRNDLARWRGEAGDSAGAAAALERLLDDSMRVLGPDHPGTLTARNNLAYWRGQAGDPAGAAAAFEQLLDDSMRVLGPDHPATLTTRHEIAYWRGQAGDPAGAAAALEQLLDDRLRVLGPDHPHTLATRGNLAYWRGEAGDPADAAAVEQLLDDRLRVLGPDHPDALAARGNLTYWRGQARDPVGAAAVVQQLPAELLVRDVIGPSDVPPIEPAPEVGREPERLLVARAPTQVPVGQDLSVDVRIVSERRSVPPDAIVSRMAGLVVDDNGTLMTLTVHVPAGLHAEGPLQHTVRLMPAEDPPPIRFGFVARTPGLHRIDVTAWAGGTFLAEVSVEVSVDVSGAFRDGQPKVASLGTASARPGEVTMEVRFNGSQYTFQLRSDAALFAPVVESVANTPNAAVENAIKELQQLASGSSRYSATMTREVIRSAGIQLWSEMVPADIRDQFWQVGGDMSAFTIATDYDLVPWELLYPLSTGNDAGFLVEQVPVVRRTYGQRRTPTVGLGNPRFVIPTKAPTGAHDEIAAVSAILGAAHSNPITKADDLLALINSGEMGATHFACHNTFSPDGSYIDMDGGRFKPTLLAEATIRKTLERTGPLVFINACRSAGAAPTYTKMLGWAQQFMSSGAGAFVGTLWAVRTESSARFATAFYRSLADGATLGAAALVARTEQQEDPLDPTWLAYTVYGDPFATAI